MKNIYVGLVLLLSPVASFAQSLTDSLVAHYPLNGDVQDHSGNGHHLTNNNAVSTAGRNGAPGTAYKFTGSASYMSSASPELLQPEYTWSCWMKVDQMPGSGNYSIAINAGGLNKDNALMIANNHDSYTGVKSFSYYATMGGNVTVLSAPGVDTAVWHFYTLTRNADSFKIFVDGVQHHAMPTTDDAGYDGSNLGFYLGGRHGTVQFFNGKLDDVRIWKRTLAPTEINQLYSQSLNSISSEAGSTLQVNVYPNPSSGVVSIETDVEISSVSVFNSMGQQVSVPAVFEVGKMTLNLTPGTFIIRLQDDQGNRTQRKVVVL